MGKQSTTLEQRISRFIRENSLVTSGSCLLLAVSGGPDSTCLLHLLVCLKKELGIELHVAHLDHQLRGADSEADADYVAELALKLGVPATIEKRDVKAHRKEKRISLEEAAREVRYRFLADTAAIVGARRIATGHTLDDQVETILMHLIRGTGTRGLQGLKPGSEWLLNGKTFNVVRPLLKVSRRETAEYCRRYGLVPRLDASNLSLSPLRNRIRHQLVPLLESYNPRVAEALLRTSAITAEQVAFLDGEVSRLWNDIVQEKEGIIVLDKGRLLLLHHALKCHLLRAAIEQLLGSLKDIETRHIEEIMAVLDKPAGKQISLPSGLIFVVEYGRYLLSLGSVNTCPYPVIGSEYSISIPGKTKLPGWQVEAEIIDRKKGPKGGKAPLTNLPPTLGRDGDKGGGLPDYGLTAYLDLDKAGDKLLVRSRQPGDLFQPLGLSQPKKLNRFMIDARIPRAWRERIPVVCSPTQIVWLVGYRIDDRVKVTENTKQVLRLEFKRITD